MDESTPAVPADHPRDLPEGRQLYLENGRNYANLVQPLAPYTFLGCSGKARFTFDILSEDRQQARARAADGSFPITLLEFEFQADQPADPGCAGLASRWCSAHVELKRLTP